MMKKTKKRLTRLLAICVCLIVVLSACASVDAPSDNSTSTEESKATSALELSEVNAESTSSETEPLDESSESEPSTPEGHISADDEASLSGNITITPIEPTYPEERETTLELVKEYPLGEGGIPFDIWEGENPAYKKVDLPGWFFADEHGNLYAFTGTAIYDLQSGEKLELSRDDLLISRIMALNGKIYALDIDGTMSIYTMQTGKEGSVQYPAHSKDKAFDIFVSADQKICVVADGAFYDANGKKIAEEYVIGTFKKGEACNIFGKTYTFDQDIFIKRYLDGNLLTSETQTYRNKVSLPDQSAAIETFYEDIVYQYDKNGDPLSEFMIYRYSDPQSVPCSISYDGLECTSYEPVTISVGNQVFKELLWGYWFVGADGTIYLLVIDPEGGELYKINPGYSDVEFTDYEADVKTELQQTATTASTTVKHAKVSAEVAEQRADAMVSLSWTVQPENRYVRTGAALPSYLADDDYEREQSGIPYCWNGFNGLDTVDSGYKNTKFADVITQEANDGKLYMAGNTEEIDQNNMVGLDCSGFVSSAYGLTTKQGTPTLPQYGHKVTDGVLNSMDLLVLPYFHCYLFDWKDVTVPGVVQYWVYDCTRSDNRDKTSNRVIYATDFTNYQHLRPCYTYVPDASPNYHTYSCASCGITNRVEYHVWSEMQVDSVYHTKKCTICGYTVRTAHTYEYESISATKHKETCAACGYTVTRSHALTYNANSTRHWQTCSECGYASAKVPHLFEYTYDLTQHWQVCETCGYAKTKTAHTYNIYGVCTVCGYRGTIMKSDEPDLPQDVPEVPTDDFIVLCVDPKEQLWESIQR